MLFIPNEKTVFWDVDDTLVLWNLGKKGDPGVIEVAVPVTRSQRTLTELGYEIEELVSEQGEWLEYLVPHKKHIEQMRIHKSRGHFNVVWSAGGAAWAMAAVEALGIHGVVDIVMAKPAWAYDDKQPEHFMPRSQWMKDE